VILPLFVVVRLSGGDTLRRLRNDARARRIVSFADIEAAARQIMTAGGYRSVATVRKELKRGSTTTIAEAMRRIWKDQAALSAGNPVALTRLPPELADAAVSLWEQALQLSQQTVTVDDNAARMRLERFPSVDPVAAPHTVLKLVDYCMSASPSALRYAPDNILESTYVLIHLDVLRGDNLLCINERAALTYLSMADVSRLGCRPGWPPWGE
jgi:hypothetical protein